MKSDKKKKAKAYYLKGLNATEIATLTGYSHRTIKDFIRLGKWRSEKATKPTTSDQSFFDYAERQKFFEYMANEHGVLLLETDLIAIERIILKK